MVPGIYRFEVWGSGITGAPKVVLEDVEIPAGGSVEKTVEFLAGELTIVVTHDGEPFATPIKIEDAAGNTVFDNWSNWPKQGTRVVTLPEGDFTVQVINIRDTKQVATFEPVHITAGQSETILVAFPLQEATPTYGTLEVTATKNGKPFFTFVTLTHQESGKQWTKDSTSGETGTVAIRLDPGTYTAELKDTDVSGGQTPTVRFKDIVIVAGETVERTADFSDGTFALASFLNGKPFSTNVFFYRPGEKKHFVNLMTNHTTGDLKRKLLPGVYRIEVRAHKLAGKPQVLLEDVEIPPGTTVEKTVEFFGGELTVNTTCEGEPFSTPFKVIDAAGKEICKPWTDNPRHGTRTIQLPEGDFTVQVINIRDTKQVATFDRVHIAADASETISAAFPLEAVPLPDENPATPAATPPATPGSPQPTADTDTAGNDPQPAAALPSPASTGKWLEAQGFPLYANARIVKEMMAGNIKTARLEAAAQMAAVVAYYKTELTGRGWQPGMEIPGDRKHTLFYTRDNQRMIMEFKPGDGKVSFSVNLVVQ